MMYPEKMPTWTEMAQELADLQLDPFAGFNDILQEIGMTTNNANVMFLYDYAGAEVLEDDPRRIPLLFEAVAIDNAKKYETLIETYPFSQMRKHIRAPDLTKTIGGGSKSKTKVARKQTETQTETPNGYGQTRTHSVNPFDNSGFKTEYEDSVTNTGTRTVSTSYTGNPDETETENTANSSEKNTGTETITETVIGNGSLSMKDAMQDMAQAATIWHIIEIDIAKKIFLQVWR